jgi:peptidoglycan DL-endopeptidase CwlO
VTCHCGISDEIVGPRYAQRTVISTYHAGMHATVPILRSRSFPRQLSIFRHSSIMRRSAALLVALAVGAGLLIAGPAPAYADPDGSASLTELTAQLDAAARAYNDAKGRLDVATAKQAQLATEAQASAAQLAQLREQVQSLAATMYTEGRLSDLNMLLDAGTADEFLDRATSLKAQAEIESDQLHNLTAAQRNYDQLQSDMAQQVAVANNQLALMDKQKKAAEAALAKAKAGAAASGPSASGSAASPAPRNADGSFPAESCTEDDPTTSGCLTPRTLHAYNEVKKAGFTHYVSCYRSGGSGEHPKGRACDWSANATTFVDARATGSDQQYGDRLASWFLANANALGILYVIWYKRIWMPSTGWRSYTGDGTPAGDHYNHVHMSIQ